MKFVNLLQLSYTFNANRNSLLTSHIGDMRLIPAVEDCLGMKSEGWHWRLGLELLNVHIVLHVHLQDGIASTLGLNLDGAPGIWNLRKII